MIYQGSAKGFGVAVSLSASSRRLFEVMQRGLPAGFRFSSKSLQAHSFEARNVLSEIELRESGRLVFRGTAHRALRDALEAALELFVTTESENLAFLHAGGVAHLGRVLLLPGNSHAGKSTLVEALLRRGATYLSDDMVPLDHRTCARPFPRWIGKRAKAGAAPVKTSPERLGFKIETRTLPVALVWCGIYRAGAVQPSFHRRQGNAAFAALLPHAPGVRTRPTVVLPALTALAKRVPVFVGVRGDADQMASALMERLEAASIRST